VVTVTTLGQIGVVGEVYAAPWSRGQGVGSTLLAHAIDYCRRALFEQVILSAPSHCPANRLYTSVGFNPVTTFSYYERIR
jgi:GNAT superfamily N-acetyltransferase